MNSELIQKIAECFVDFATDVSSLIHRKHQQEYFNKVQLLKQNLQKTLQPIIEQQQQIQKEITKIEAQLDSLKSLDFTTEEIEKRINQLEQKKAGLKSA